MATEGVLGELGIRRAGEDESGPLRWEIDVVVQDTVSRVVARKRLDQDTWKAFGKHLSSRVLIIERTPGCISHYIASRRPLM